MSNRASAAGAAADGAPVPILALAAAMTPASAVATPVGTCVTSVVAAHCAVLPTILAPLGAVMLLPGAVVPAVVAALRAILPMILAPLGAVIPAFVSLLEPLVPPLQPVRSCLGTPLLNPVSGRSLAILGGRQPGERERPTDHPKAPASSSAFRTPDPHAVSFSRWNRLPAAP